MATMANRRRRNSLNVFRPQLSALTPIHDESPRDTEASSSTLKKKLRPGSLLPGPSSTPSSPLEPRDSINDLERESSPLIRPRALQKSTRPPSIFGSFRSARSLPDEDESLIRVASDCNSIDEEEAQAIDLDSMSLLQHGEVQTAGSMFRKRVQYLVLTSTHLIRFKNKSKAAEMFPAIPASIGRSSGAHHARMSSGSSAPESYLNVDHSTTIPLQNVVAVYKLDDGKPYFTLELAAYDEASNHVSTLSIQLNDPRESELWLTSVRAAVTKIRLTANAPFGRKAVEYVARALEYESDYDPNHFRMFIVAQRASKSGNRSSTDDLGKLQSSVCYLVIGFHKVHLVPLPVPSKSSSNTSMPDLSGTSHGVMLLSSVYLQHSDDSFQLGFRTPFQPAAVLQFASASVSDIALCLRQAADFLRPTWLEQPFTWRVPKELDEAMLPVPPAEEEDNLAFDRTLTAYCVAYNIDPSKIRYTVHDEGEDAPEFELLEPNDARRTKYSALELLAIIRALRYNESFRAMSFRSAKLDALHAVYDRQGSEHFMWKTRSGQSISLPRLDQTPLMVQELQCLALKSSRLRRLDFSNCLSRKPKDLESASDPGSLVCEAIFPLCTLQLTNVDWITLDGVALSDIDIEYLFAAALKKTCHFRALEVGRCGLSEEMLNLALSSMTHQEETLESLNLSGNPARLSAEHLARQLGRFKRIRKLNLSHLLLNSNPEPILSFDTLLKWRLESLTLSGTSINAESVDDLASYLLSRQSDTLQEIRLEQCQMSGEDVATLLESMCEGRAEPRQLHLYVSENRLEKHHDKMAQTIARSMTPTHMSMRMLEYSKESNFQGLVDALAINDTLEYLDISRVSLPYDAGKTTCEKLQHMLATNTSLQTLNLSGEQAHLEAVTLGRNLPHALRGLEQNSTLRVLTIEHQTLGLPGAGALASALAKNSTLEELHCDDNDINLQAFTVLVNGVRDNHTLLYLSDMDQDRAASRSKVDREITSLLSAHAVVPKATSTHGSSGGSAHTSSGSSGQPQRSGVRRALSGAVSAGSRSLAMHRSASAADKHPAPPVPPLRVTEQDVQAAVASLEDSWTAEKQRLSRFLQRNYRLAHGVPLEEPEAGGGGGGAAAPARGSPPRPPTAGSLATALRNATLDQTPTAELDRQLGAPVLHLGTLGAPASPSLGPSDGHGGPPAASPLDVDGLVMDAGKRKPR